MTKSGSTVCDTLKKWEEDGENEWIQRENKFKYIFKKGSRFLFSSTVQKKGNMIAERY